MHIHIHSDARFLVDRMLKKRSILILISGVINFAMIVIIFESIEWTNETRKRSKISVLELRIPYISGPISMTNPI